MAALFELVPYKGDPVVKKIRKRLTYANVMSSIAVFLVLGGATALAAGLGKNSVGSKQLKKNAVTTAKIKNNAVTTSKIKNGAISGAKINLSSLGTVPSASHAGSADSATNAGHANSADNANNANNANTVGGNRIVKFSLNGGDDISKRQILDLNGLQLFAECSSGDTTVIAKTSTDESEISAFAADASGGDFEFEYEDEFNPGDEITLPPNSNSDVLGDGFFTGGNLQTVQFFYNEEDSVPSGDCVFNGYAIG
jgi:hypothetical protein